MKYSSLEPKEVFDYFKAISSIPHGSGNTQAITSYILEFAEQHQLRSYHDEMGNVIVYKDASPDHLDSEPVILQGHVDMVCDKTDSCPLDMAKDSLILRCDGEMIWAEGTTLGADDGIAVAYMLAVLASKDLSHPPIEALFTVDEEIGMLGARALDASALSGKRLINIDSEEEGVLTTSCAGGVRAIVSLPVCYSDTNELDTAYSISINRLKGGHSGIDILKFRRNANVLLGRILDNICERIPVSLAAFDGGVKENVIPSLASCTVYVRKADEMSFKTVIRSYIHSMQSESEISDMTVTVLREEEFTGAYLDQESMRKVIFYLTQSPNGVQSLHASIEGMVQASLNMGRAMLQGNQLIVRYLIRGNSEAGKRETVTRLKAFAAFLGGEITLENDYPAWEYRMVSPLRDAMVENYRKVYGEEPIVTAIHAGLECGLLADKVEDIDMVSFGPTLENVHTPQEKMNVASAQRCWVYLKTVLQNL